MYEFDSHAIFQRYATRDDYEGCRIPGLLFMLTETENQHENNKKIISNYSMENKMTENFIPCEFPRKSSNLIALSDCRFMMHPAY